MTSKKFFSMLAVACMLMVAEPAHAQFFKKLGKELKNIGKEILETAQTNAENGVVTTADGMTIVSGHPDLKIEVQRCVTSGSNLFLDLVLTNTNSNDVSSFLIHGSAIYTTKFYDNLGNIYDDEIYVKVANKDYTLYDYTFKLVSGLPTSVSILVKGFSTRATSLALVEPYCESREIGIEPTSIKLRNIPITRAEE